MEFVLPEFDRLLRVDSTPDSTCEDENEQIHGDDCLSLIEQLPKELIWRIIESVPESIIDLRYTCPILRSHVNEYGRQRRTIPLIETLKLSGSQIGTRGTSEADPRVVLSVVMTVSTAKSNLLQLRLHSNQLLDKLEGRILKIPGMGRRSNIVHFAFNLCEDDIDLLAAINYWTSDSISAVELYQYYGKKQLAFISQLLEGTKIRRLKIVIQEFGNEALEHLKRTIYENSVDQLSLSVCRCVASVDYVALLLELSEVLHSIHINQYAAVKDIDSTASYLFGIHCIDWANFIMNMFSGKLDKLFIENQYYPEYLSLSMAETLRKRLPEMGKSVWFVATCIRYDNGINETYRDHLIKADRNAATDAPCFLRIKHASREAEAFEYVIA